MDDVLNWLVICCLGPAVFMGVATAFHASCFTYTWGVRTLKLPQQKYTRIIWMIISLSLFNGHQWGWIPHFQIHTQLVVVGYPSYLHLYHHFPKSHGYTYPSIYLSIYRSIPFWLATPLARHVPHLSSSRGSGRWPARGHLTALEDDRFDGGPDPKRMPIDIHLLFPTK